jgi:hypothetical protein
MRPRPKGRHDRCVNTSTASPGLAGHDVLRHVRLYLIEHAKMANQDDSCASSAFNTFEPQRVTRLVLRLLPWSDGAKRYAATLSSTK